MWSSVVVKGGTKLKTIYLTEACCHFAPPTHLQQIFAAFQRFIAKICISLFFFASASKLTHLLITTNSTFTNLFKRTLIQMSLYGHLTTRHPRQKTNLFKLFAFLPSLAKRGGVLSLRAAERVGDGGLRRQYKPNPKGKFV
jgi:hypothetical protein